MKLLYAALFVLALAGCRESAGSTKQPPPVNAQCEDALCYAPCVDEAGDTGIRWDAPALTPLAWDVLASDVAAPLADRLRQCDQNRRACTQCLDRLKKAGVIQ